MFKKVSPPKFISFIAVFFLSALLFGQVPQNGVKKSAPIRYALTNATIVVSPEETIQKGTLIVEGDQIINVGSLIKIPKGTIEIDCKGLYILPSFIELSSEIGLPAIKKNGQHSFRPQLNSAKQGAYYWNESIHPESDASTNYSINSKDNQVLLNRGFGFALTHKKDGVAQGKGAFVALINTDVHKSLTDWANHSFFSFSKGSSRQTYPSSQMGSIALLRQALYDAQWYKNQPTSERNLSLEALLNNWDSPSFFHVANKWEILRAEKIRTEFGLNFSYIGSGDEYGIIEQLKELKGSIIAPINFPKAYDVTNPYVARQIPLSDLKHWEMAPHNLRILHENQIPFCITSTGHKTDKEFWEHLRKSIQVGLPESEALAALTIHPATLLGINDKIGSLSKGKKASFTVYSANPLQEEAKIVETWGIGIRTVQTQLETVEIAGTYDLLIGQRNFEVEIKGKNGKWSGETQVFSEKQTEKGISTIDTTTIKLAIQTEKNDINIQFNINHNGWDGSVNLHGKINERVGVFEGEGMIPTGEWVKWSSVQKHKAKPSKESDNNTDQVPVHDSLARNWFPNMAYGFDSIPAQESLIIKNGTIWTNEEDGIIENGTVVIDEGKIIFCGTGRHPSPKGARIIDVKGGHITSGIIDEHSHIAISKGVNESGQAISAEVSIGDVINPDDINIYRQLSGGVTAAQLLHGSANPIGGQSALIKLKWGHTADEILIDNAPKFIKFALGENVKQANWGDFNTVRFPQTRMGVEQVYYDGFDRAKKYQEEKKKGLPYRVDLELEVLSEILNNERFISCHSYIQSEINMLMHVADSLGFKINTFTHILEGYKLADKMAKHGAGGSTFSDWWAYKYEVNDAIPYNAKMMADQGVVVAINSDDAEMGRRLNQEAAKAVKYGGMSEEDAWKMVTLNPAKLLHLDDRMGSLKVGKDADIVVWTDHPLSIRAKARQTIIDGKILFDSDRDYEMRTINQQEKARIISKMLADKSGPKRSFEKKKKGHFHCNTIGEEASLEENNH